MSLENGTSRLVERAKRPQQIDVLSSSSSSVWIAVVAALVAPRNRLPMNELSLTHDGARAVIQIDQHGQVKTSNRQAQ